MILKALYDYYYNCDDIAPIGYEYKEIPFLLVINEDGKFLDIEDCRIDTKTSKKFKVLKSVGRSGKKYKANTLYDNVGYTLNFDPDNKSAEKHQLFKQRCEELHKKYPKCKGIEAVCKFYDDEENIKHVFSHSQWGQIESKAGANISFRLRGEELIIAEDPCLEKEIEHEEPASDDLYCLVTGKRGKTVRLTSASPIQGSQATASLVSFQKNCGYDSYGKEQAYNSPISVEAEFAYTTALKKLLSRTSNNKFTLANRTFVFWASTRGEASQDLENALSALFNMQASKEQIDEVKETFKSIYSGRKVSTSDDKFYILGLSPNSARIAVVYWNECTVKEFAGLLLQHFDDMEIVDTRIEKKPYFGIHSILSAVTLGGKSSDAQPNLPEAVMKSMIQGVPYPYSLFSSCIRRINAEQGAIYTCRAAILKAYLNRLNNNNKKISIMIDKDNNNVGYLCGRLFATLEYVQERSSNIHTIRERYITAASTTPLAVFPTIMNLSFHHSEKLDNGSQVFFEKIKTEILNKFQSDAFPAHLSLEDQGRFFVGYYHQRAEFYSSKNEDSKNEVSE